MILLVHIWCGMKIINIKDSENHLLYNKYY